MIYTHTVQYYETDKMGITHHSNYIRWMEEARTAFLAEKGWPYDRLEKDGVFSPVVSVSCRYKKTTTYADLVDIEVYVKAFSGIRVTFGYIMRLNGETVCEAESEHCFLDANGRLYRLKKEIPDLYAFMEKEAEQNR